MRGIVCFALVISALAGQTAPDKSAVANLTSTLAGMGRFEASRLDMSRRLVDDILALAERDREPSPAVVAAFADEFTSALYGVPLMKPSVNVLQQSIRDMLHPSRAIFAPAASLRQILDRAGVDPAKSQVVTRRFMAIGEEIKGPDDVGARK